LLPLLLLLLLLLPHSTSRWGCAKPSRIERFGVCVCSR
jgi:hypothetical protein